jgi:hypothetical protein
MSVRNSIILLALTAVALTVVGPQAAAAQQIAPASARAVFDVVDRAAILVVHGVGAQIYECKVGETAVMSWVFRACRCPYPGRRDNRPSLCRSHLGTD